MLDRVLPNGRRVPPGMIFQADLQDILIFADAMISRVFSNLLDNSVRHSGNVSAIRVSCSESADGLIINWEDNGVGIPHDEKDRIFERGYGKNTGLGLFLAREILSITGMSIIETGKEGEGVRFQITVPKGNYRFQTDTSRS